VGKKKGLKSMVSRELLTRDHITFAQEGSSGVKRREEIPGKALALESIHKIWVRILKGSDAGKSPEKGRKRPKLSTAGKRNAGEGKHHTDHENRLKERETPNEGKQKKKAGREETPWKRVKERKTKGDRIIMVGRRFRS